MEILKFAGGVAVFVIVLPILMFQIWMPIDADSELVCNGSDFECEGPYNFITCVYLPNGQKLYVPNRCQPGAVCNPKNSPVEPCDLQTAPGTTISTGPTSTADRATTLKEASTMPYVRPTILTNTASKPSDQNNSTSVKSFYESKTSGFIRFEFGFNLTGFSTFSNQTSGNITKVSYERPFVIKTNSSMPLNGSTISDATTFDSTDPKSLIGKKDPQENDLQTETNSPQFSVNSVTQFSEARPKSFHTYTKLVISNAIPGVIINMKSNFNASETKNGDMSISAYGTVSFGDFLRKNSTKPTIDSSKLSANMPTHILTMSEDNETIVEVADTTVNLNKDTSTKIETETVTNPDVETTQSTDSSRLIPSVTTVVDNVDMTTNDSVTSLLVSNSSILYTSSTSNPSYSGVTNDIESRKTVMAEIPAEEFILEYTTIGSSSEVNYSYIPSNDLKPSLSNNETALSFPNIQSTITEQSANTTIKPIITLTTGTSPNTFDGNQTSSEVVGTQIEASLKVLSETSVTSNNTVTIAEENTTKSFQIEEKANKTVNSSVSPVVTAVDNMFLAEIAPNFSIEPIKDEMNQSYSIQPALTIENNGSTVEEPQKSITMPSEIIHLNITLSSKPEQNITIDESLVTYQSGTVSNNLEYSTLGTPDRRSTTESLVERSSQISSTTLIQGNLEENETGVSLNVTEMLESIVNTSLAQVPEPIVNTSLVGDLKPENITSVELTVATGIGAVNLTTHDFLQSNQSVNNSSTWPNEILYSSTTETPPQTRSTTYGPYDPWDFTSAFTQTPNPTQQSAEIFNTQVVLSLEVTNNDFISAEITSKPTTQTTFSTPTETFTTDSTTEETTITSLTETFTTDSTTEQTTFTTPTESFTDSTTEETTFTTPTETFTDSTTEQSTFTMPMETFTTDSTTEFTTPIELDVWMQSSTNKDRGARALGSNTATEDIDQVTEPYIEKTTLTANEPLRYNLSNTVQDDIGNFSLDWHFGKDIHGGNSTNETMFTLEVIADSKSMPKSFAIQGMKAHEATLQTSQGFLNTPFPVEPVTPYYQPNNTIQFHEQNSSSLSHTLGALNAESEPQKRELQKAKPVVVIHQPFIQQPANMKTSNSSLPSTTNDANTTSLTKYTIQQNETASYASNFENTHPTDHSKLPNIKRIDSTDMENNRSNVQTSESISFKSNLLQVNFTIEPSFLDTAKNLINDTMQMSEPAESLIPPQESATSPINFNNSRNLLNNSINVSNEQIALATTANTNPTDTEPFLVCQKHGVFADVNNCQQYYLCVQQHSGFVKILGTCPLRTAFSPAAQRCVKDVSRCYNEKCTVKGNFPDPLDKTSYFSCIETETGVFAKFHEQCAAPLTFSSTKGRCDLGTDSTNHILSPTKTTVVEIEQTTIPNPTSYATHKLIEPEYREMSATTNNYETAFIESFPMNGPETTVQVSNTESAVRSVRSTNSFECSQDGVFPSRESCKDYYMCVKKADGGFTQIRRQCPAHYAFHSRSKSCSRDMSVCSDLWCYGIGNFPDPKDHTSYYRCVPNARGGFRIYHIKCAEPKIYDPIKNMCFENTTSLPILVTTKKNISPDTKEKEMLVDEPDYANTTTEANYEILNKTSNISNKYPVVSENYRVQAEEKLRGILQDMRDEAVRQHEAEILLKRKSRESENESNASSDGISEETLPYICTEEGRFPDKNNCRQYFICSKRGSDKMKLHHLTCRGSDKFDAAKRICVDEEDARCLN